MQNRDLQSLDFLKTLPDYQRSFQKPKMLGYIGRMQNIKRYLKDHVEEIFYPEHYGETWSVEKNMAYMLGGIEAKRPFLIVSPLNHIANRAQDAARHRSDSLGYTTAEILWLQDNGYTFSLYYPDPSLCIATPPEKGVATPVINSYGIKDSDTASQQIQRIVNLKNEMDKQRQNRTEKKHSLHESEKKNYEMRFSSFQHSRERENRKEKRHHQAENKARGGIIIENVGRDDAQNSARLKRFSNS